MNIFLQYNTIKPRIDEEISRVADELYADDGSPLYDSVVLTSKDTATVMRHIDDAVSAFVSRAFDIVTVDTSNTTPQSKAALNIYVPDFDDTMTQAVDAEFRTYCVCYACAMILQHRAAAYVPEYTDRAKAAMDKCITLLKSRKTPV